MPLGLTTCLALTFILLAVALWPFRNSSVVPISLAAVCPVECFVALLLPWILYGVWTLGDALVRNTIAFAAP